MKHYLATEAKLIAKNFNYRKYKKELDAAIDDAMFLIGEAAKRGEYSTLISVENLEKSMRISFDVIMQENGYIIEFSDEPGCCIAFWSK